MGNVDYYENRAIEAIYLAHQSTDPIIHLEQAVGLLVLSIATRRKSNGPFKRYKNIQAAKKDGWVLDHPENCKDGDVLYVKNGIVREESELANGQNSQNLSSGSGHSGSDREQTPT